jgi:hypothetical protein
LDTEIIDTENAPPFEAGARLFARLAFPLPSDRTVRELAFSTLVRWAVEWMKEDAILGRQPVLIRPRHLASEETQHDKLFRRLLDIFDDRMLVVRHITLPLFVGRPGPRSDGAPLTFTNLASNALDQLGWASGSEKTFADDWWKPSRPVAHAATAFRLFFRLPFLLDSMFDAMNDKAHLEKIVVASEILRRRYDSDKLYKRFKLHEADTIQFRLFGC